MIDIHSHILPGLDDGPKKISQAIEMCRLAEADGIHTIVATPHTLNGVYQNEKGLILKGVQDLRQILEREGIGIEILPGTDTHVHPGLLDHIMNGHAMTLNDTGRYIMLEFPDYFIFQNISKLLDLLISKGMIPIISHPERNRQMMRKIEILREMVAGGALSQITAMSITGKFGRQVKKAAEKMIKENLVQVIASDSHSPNHRPPVLSPAIERVRKWIGAEEALDMVTTIPEAIINGRRI
jgi:protein-tyrosine phosphatase